MVFTYQITIKPDHDWAKRCQASEYIRTALAHGDYYKLNRYNNTEHQCTRHMETKNHKRGVEDF